MRTPDDLLVLGAGIAGLAAAVSAAEAGLEVRVVDPDPVAGGTARFAAGGMCIAGSPTQVAHGIEDDAATALEDWVAAGGDTVDLAWATRYLERSVPDVHDLVLACGVPWVAVERYEGNRVPRFHRPRGGGAAVVAALEHRARATGRVRFDLGTAAEALLRVGPEVRGARVRGPAGPLDRYATTTLLATGGSCGSVGHVRRDAEIRPTHPLLAAGGPGATGAAEGLLAGMDVATANTGVHWIYPFATPSPWTPGRGLVLRGIEHDMWVDERGDRFHDESQRGGKAGTEALRERGGRAWSVSDAITLDRFEISDPRFRGSGMDGCAQLRLLADASAGVHVVDDLDDLPSHLDLDVARLRRTLAEHVRERRRGGRDDRTGRDLSGLPPLDRPPFVIAELRLAARKNLGGVVTDGDGVVRRWDGTSVPGLLAAGEVAGMAGGHVNGRGALEGTMAGPSLFSGWVAGRTAAS